MSKRRLGKKLSRKVVEDVVEYLPSCFVCDKPVKNNGVQIILGRTPYSNISLPTKIGQLIGDNFMVVVGESDAICSRCASLISQLDRLETDACSVKKTLMGFIAIKYQLNHEEICSKIGVEVGSDSPEESSQDSLNSFAVSPMEKDNRKKALQVSLLAPNKITKLTAISCKTCNFSTPDRDALQIHSALCLKQVHLCLQCGDNLFNDSGLYSYAATCNICSLNYDSDAEYSEHMILHTDGSCKCLACNFTNTQRDDLVGHVLSHGLQIFQCCVCETTFHLKADLSEHLETHMVPNKCLKCSVSSISESKPSALNEIPLVNLSGDDMSNEMQIERKQKAENEYLESLMRASSFDSDGCSIEFLPCPNCGVTFVNKMFFAEHMKMHDVNQSQDLVNSNDQDDVLKSSTVSVAGDCSIDDDLEDLFEKLHAETTNSSLVTGPGAAVEGTEEMLCEMGNSQDLNFSETLKTEHLAFSASSASTIPPLAKFITTSSEAVVNVKGDSLKTNLDSTAFNSFHTSAEKEKIFSNQEASNDLFDSSEQSTFIYITNGDNSLAGFDSQDGVIVQSATIDAESGNIQLLPYVINNPVSSSQLLENDVDCSDESDLLKQGLCSSKSELDLVASSTAVIPPASSATFSCDFCSFQTSIELVLQRHLKVHQGDMDRKCSICNRIFSSTQRLLSHIDMCHKDTGPIRCPMCPQDFDNCNHLRSHLAESHPVGKHDFTCRFCSKKFTSRKSCTVHEESHSEVFKFCCEICSKRFTSQDDLVDHVKWDHHKAGQCRYCGKKIDKPKALKHHELRHMQESNHHECPECKRVFKTKTGLRHHAATHTGQFKYCCDFCGRGFMSRMMLEEHRSCHTKEERYVCDICGQKFTVQSTYWIHKKWHETPFPYKCNVCDRLFKHSSLLAVHKRKHTGERPYRCPYCPLTFPVSGTLKRHIILHTGLYPFNCDSCKRGFTAKHKYAAHLEKVHGKKESVTSTTNTEPSKLIGRTDTDHVKEWDLDDITLESNVHRFDVPEESIGNRDPLISDQAMPSRVVQIVYENSFQPVATVTLGGSESIIPENWYV